VSLDEARSAIEKSGAEVSTAQTVRGANGSVAYQQVTTGDMTAEETSRVKTEVAQELGISEKDISNTRVSGAWGRQITDKALLGLLIFLGVVLVYLILRFEWRMAVAALTALLQNLLLTAAVYSLVGFEVTPSTIIGFLTILGFALYDVVVVFDKVRENTQGITGNPNRTYAEAANLAVNQTLMRSINTAIVALLPVGGLLFIGAGLLKAGTLKDLGLVLFVGMLAAVYSSIFLATPVLVDLKEQEPKFKLHKQRVLARRAAGTTTERKAARAAAVDTEEGDTVLTPTAPPRTGARPSQQRKRPGGKPGGGKAGARSGGGRSGGKRR